MRGRNVHRRDAKQTKRVSSRGEILLKKGAHEVSVQLARGDHLGKGNALSKTLGRKKNLRRYALSSNVKDRYPVGTGFSLSSHCHPKTPQSLSFSSKRGKRVKKRSHALHGGFVGTTGSKGLKKRAGTEKTGGT